MVFSTDDRSRWGGHRGRASELVDEHRERSLRQHERMHMEGRLRSGRRGGFGFRDEPRDGFPFGPFGHGPGFGRGPKVARGDVRIAVLRLLAEEPRNGYQLIQELSKRSDGVWRPSPGSIYPVLQLLGDEGLVRSTEIDGKRVFQLTDEGQTVAKGLGEHLAAPWETASGNVDDATFDLRNLIGQVAAATVQVSQAGTDAQIEKAKELLVGTRRSLYRILADDESDTATEN